MQHSRSELEEWDQTATGRMAATLALMGVALVAAAATAPPNSWAHRPQFLPVCDNGLMAGADATRAFACMTLAPQPSTTGGDVRRDHHHITDAPMLGNEHGLPVVHQRYTLSCTSHARRRQKSDDDSSETDCNVMKFGAKGDNITEDTQAIAAALTACAAKSGRTIVPRGTYLIRPLNLPSGTDLVLQPGSTLAAWPDRYTWPNSTNKPCDFAREGSSACHKNLPTCVPQKESLLFAENATDISISGGGTIDGNANGNDWHLGPSNASADGKHRGRGYNDFWHQCRPRMIEIRYSQNIRVDNINIHNSIMFNVKMARVSGVRISNVHIHSLGPNTDGFNIAGNNMELVDSTVCNNDDCVPVNAPTNGLIVRNVSCLCQWGGGFVPMIGDKDTSWGADCQYKNNVSVCSPSGDIVNVTFSDSTFNHTSTAVIMKSMPVFDGQIVNVTYENLRLHNVRTGVCINTQAQECFPRGSDDRWLAHARSRGGGGKVDVMNVKGITVRNVSGEGVGLAGYVNCPKQAAGNGTCTELTLEAINFTGAKPWVCAGSLTGAAKGCVPPACPLK